MYNKKKQTNSNMPHNTPVVSMVLFALAIVGIVLGGWEMYHASESFQNPVKNWSTDPNQQPQPWLARAAPFILLAGVVAFVAGLMTWHSASQPSLRYSR